MIIRKTDGGVTIDGVNDLVFTKGKAALEFKDFISANTVEITYENFHVVGFYSHAKWFPVLRARLRAQWMLWQWSALNAKEGE